MRFVISLLAVAAIAGATGLAADDTLRERVLRDQALKAGLVSVESLLPPIDAARSAAGRLLFESKTLSLTNEIACQNCHLDRFAAADGIPLGIGTRGEGEGIERMRHGGDMLPRHTLPFWGRGALGFNVFFWDGRVDNSSGTLVSQFGDEAPSSDPLVVAAHLPPVEIKEMVRDDEAAEALRTETIASAQQIYTEIARRVQDDPALSAALIKAYRFRREDIRYLHVAESIAAFIRDRFRLHPTRLHDFVLGDGALTEEEIAGGLLFYGRGRCAACHNGPYFSDLAFHAIPFGQFGRGRNGFGIDYGRFNVTLDPADLYKFRTPPLYNVAQTAPYSHSGSEYDLAAAIRVHVDPLAAVPVAEMDAADRAAFYQRLGQWVQEPVYGVELDDTDIAALRAFLETLSFPDTAAGSGLATAE
jgi:cytochrome c peroxidase